MKKMKKALAMILSLAMVLAMSLTAFAADSGTDPGSGDGDITPPTITTTDMVDKNVPTAADHGVVTINGLAAGDKVTLYKIAQPKYDEVTGKGILNYETNYSITDVFNPTAEEITTIAQAVTASDIARVAKIGDEEPANATGTVEGTSIEFDMNVGMYLVLVAPGTDNMSTVYNPMIVSVYYTRGDDNSTVTNGGTVDAANPFKVGSESAYAKRSKAEITKEIVNYGSNGNSKGDDTARGDEISFKVTADIPVYSDEYKKLSDDDFMYQIADQVKGLTNLRDIKVYLNDETNEDNLVATENYTQSIKNKEDAEATNDGTSFTLDFNRDYIIGLTTTSPQKFIVTYKATLDANSGVNFDANDNTVTLTYSNDPHNKDSKGTDEDKTYHYTFSIDGFINGEDSYRTGEFIKTDENDSEFRPGEEITISNPLEGAEFTLTKTDETYKTPEEGFTPKVVTTDASGRTLFEGLDAGYYTIQETKAPAGYSLVTTVYKVKIDASYNSETGLLENYTIDITDGEGTKRTSSYSTTNQKDDAGRLIITDNNKDENGVGNDSSTTLFRNTKLSELPSTGGIGTTIFTIGGCIIMIVAAGLFFASRRKKAEN